LARGLLSLSMSSSMSKCPVPLALPTGRRIARASTQADNSLRQASPRASGSAVGRRHEARARGAL
jgi:hypothetical protein